MLSNEIAQYKATKHYIDQIKVQLLRWAQSQKFNDLIQIIRAKDFTLESVINFLQEKSASRPGFFQRVLGAQKKYADNYLKNQLSIEKLAELVCRVVESYEAPLATRHALVLNIEAKGEVITNLREEKHRLAREKEKLKGDINQTQMNLSRLNGASFLDTTHLDGSVNLSDLSDLNNAYDQNSRKLVEEVIDELIINSKAQIKTILSSKTYEAWLSIKRSDKGCEEELWQYQYRQLLKLGLTHLELAMLYDSIVMELLATENTLENVMQESKKRTTKIRRGERHLGELKGRCNELNQTLLDLTAIPGNSAFIDDAATTSTSPWHNTVKAKNYLNNVLPGLVSEARAFLLTQLMELYCTEFVDERILDLVCKIIIDSIAAPNGNTSEVFANLFNDLDISDTDLSAALNQVKEELESKSDENTNNHYSDGQNYNVRIEAGQFLDKKSADDFVSLIRQILVKPYFVDLGKGRQAYKERIKQAYRDTNAPAKVTRHLRKRRSSDSQEKTRRYEPRFHGGRKKHKASPTVPTEQRSARTSGSTNNTHRKR